MKYLFRSGLSIASIVILASTSSCLRTDPRKLPPLSPEPTGSLPSTADEYERPLLNSPEMFPRELTMPERKELLRVNWAMQKAQEEGKLKVRLIAPQLQLTGDPNLDRSSTYEAILVADDLGINSFLDKYEVRVGPKPELYVVRPATSAKSLREADMILAEEELSRLRLDQATLNAGVVFATNLEPILNTRLAKAKAVSSNDVQTLSASITNLATQVSASATNQQRLEAEIATITNGLPAKVLTAGSNISVVSLSLKTIATNVLKTSSNLLERTAGSNALTAGLTLQTAASNATALASNVLEGRTNSRILTYGSNVLNAGSNVLVTASNVLALGSNVTVLTTGSNLWTSGSNALAVGSDLLAAATWDIAARAEKEATLANERKRASELITQKQSAIEELAKRKKQLDDLEYKIEAIREMGDLSAAGHAATKSLGDYWNDWANGRAYFSSYSTNGPSQTNSSAVSIMFRPQAVSQLSHITIDVIRKELSKGPIPNLTNSDAIKQSQFTSKLSTFKALKEALAEIDEPLTRLKGLLEAPERQLKNDSRQRQIDAIADQILIKERKIEAFLMLATNGLDSAGFVDDRPRYSSGIAGNGDFVAVPASGFITIAELPPNSTPLNRSVSSLASNLTSLLARSETSQREVAKLTEALAGSLGTSKDRVHAVLAATTNLFTTLEQQQKLLALIANLLSERASHGGSNGWTTNLQEAAANLWRAAAPGFEAQGRLSNAMAALTAAFTNTEGSVTALFKEQSNGVRLVTAPMERREFNDLAARFHYLQESAIVLNRNLKEVQKQIDNLVFEQARPYPNPAPWPEIKANKAMTVISPTITDVVLRLHNLKETLDGFDANENRARASVVTDLRAIRGEIAYAEVVLRGVYASELQTTQEALRNPDEGVVGQILRGEQAIFRIKVLHAVVTTTGFLLADDGAAQIFGQAFADQFYVAQVTFKNPNDKPILIYGNTMRLVVRMNAIRPDGSLSEDGLPISKKWWATYEPLDYDTIRRMLEGQQEYSWQRNLTKVLDLALMAGGGWVGVGAPSDGFTRAFSVFSALSPKLRDTLEADLHRNAMNFREKGLNAIEEIPAHGILTRYVFLPKGPIYGTYAFDEAEAAELPLSSKEHRAWNWVPFVKSSRSFGNRALLPAYIHDIRREEVYVDGKRILASDPLSSAVAR